MLSIAFSPDGDQIAAASNGQGQLWRVEGLSTVARFAVPTSQYFEDMTLTFDAAGRYLAVAGGDSGAVWDVRSTPVERVTIRHEGRIGRLAFSPDGSYVAAGGEAAASVFSMLTGREVARMTHPPSVVGLEFVRDGRALLTVGWDGSTRFWETDASRRAIVPFQTVCRMRHSPTAAKPSSPATATSTGRKSSTCGPVEPSADRTRRRLLPDGNCWSPSGFHRAW